MVKEYKEGSIVVGTVTGIKDYGIFVKLDNNNSGLIHISEIGNHYIEDLNKYVTQNELIRVRIVEKTSENMLKLSIKNVDYRITKRHGSRIKETPGGFKNLALHLDYWISKELESLKKWKNMQINYWQSRN